MAILLPTERKSTKGRLIHAGIIALLLLGGVTMVYPFLVMLSGSVRSTIDENELNLVPEFLVDDAALYRKFLEFKYNGDVAALNRAHQTNYFSFAEAELPSTETHGRLRSSLVTWTNLFPTFDPETPTHTFVLGGLQADRTVPGNLRRAREMLMDRFEGDLGAYVEAGGAPTPSWLTVVLPPPRWFDRRYDFPQGPLFDVYQDLAEARPITERQPLSLSGHFLQTMVLPRFGGDLAKIGEVLAENGQLERLADFHLARYVPSNKTPVYRELWTQYLRDELNPSFIRPFMDGRYQDADDVGPIDQAFQRFLSETYGSIHEMNHAWESDYAAFSDLPTLADRWLRGVEKQDYLRFLASYPIEQLQIIDPTPRVEMSSPFALANREWEYVQFNAVELRTQFAARNYINVWDELAGEGRALWNTLIYCTLSIVLALLINPLAAYGLSRFKLRGGYKALLILMATMAFPPMVTLIPQFIALRNLGLMNTFVALLLPLIANGYLIFLLKGFFDSLPRELYEAGTIDGASELRMFFQIAMALSKPILAVVALQTFTAAYTMFLYALLVAPDRDMWLISVWLFQYQERASSSGVFASVVIASVPTLLLFLLVQRTIMRGIVVPTEK
ncbi:MAG: ABC transporter permease subunit [Planctomycetota bacterium]